MRAFGRAEDKVPMFALLRTPDERKMNRGFTPGSSAGDQDDCTVRFWTAHGNKRSPHELIFAIFREVLP
jgi:hypothetical protein